MPGFLPWAPWLAVGFASPEGLVRISGKLSFSTCTRAGIALDAVMFPVVVLIYVCAHRCESRIKFYPAERDVGAKVHGFSIEKRSLTSLINVIGWTIAFER